MVPSSAELSAGDTAVVTVLPQVRGTALMSNFTFQVQVQLLTLGFKFTVHPKGAHEAVLLWGFKVAVNPEGVRAGACTASKLAPPCC